MKNRNDLSLRSLSLRNEEYCPCRGNGAASRAAKRFAEAQSVSGFTLIELLVVIAVISLLAALMFPVFARAREKARQATCLSNMRQVTLAILMYADDNENRCPPYGDGVSAFWPQFVSPYVQGHPGSDFNAVSKVFVCPSAPYDASAVTAFGATDLSSYGLTDNWVDQVCPDDCPQNSGIPHTFSEAVAPAGTILLAETMYQTDSQLPGYGLASSPIDAGNMNGPGGPYFGCTSAAAFSPARMLADISWRHFSPKEAWCAVPPSGAFVNVAYADGHVKSVSVGQLLDYRQWSLDQGAGTYGCHPNTYGDGQSGCWYP